MSTNVAFQNVPIPLQDAITKTKRSEFWGRDERDDAQEGLITDAWLAYFTSIGLAVQSASSRVGEPVALTNQSASIGATDISGGGLAFGMYRLTPYARITQAATVSSSLTLALDWKDDGVVQTFTWPALTGNTVTTNLVQPAIAFLSDALAPIRYTVTYASVGGTPMKYKLSLILESVGG